MASPASEIRVLHYNTAKGWRGGEQQVLYLAKGLGKYPVVQFAAGQPDEPFLERIAPYVDAPFPLKSRGEIQPSTAARLLRLIKAYRIDIVHTHSTPGHSIALQAKCFRQDFKLVAHRRVDFPVKNNPLSLYKYRSKLVDRIICISDFIRRMLASQDIPESKMTVIYSGVDFKRFHASREGEVRSMRHKLGLSKQTLVLGNVAALTGHKDHINLIRSMKHLDEKGVDFKLLILGEGEQRENCLHVIRELELGRRVLLLGFKKDLSAYYSLFDMLVHSSRDEGLGTAILDALACRIPVVATDAGGIPEILGKNRFGMVVPKQNPVLLSDAIFEMIQNKKLRMKYKASGPERAAEFSVERMVQRTFSLYREIMGLSS
jgi:glycosyltransferase involved in cell wall biosynthesis